MLDESLANLLQLFAFPLEAIGIGLAYIELRHQNLASRLMKNSSMLLIKWLTPADGLPVPKSTQMKEAAAIVLIPTILLGFLVPGFTDSFYTAHNVLMAMLFGAVLGVGMILFFGLLVPVLRWAGRFMLGFSENRGLGSLGLILASIGLVLEAYQMIVVLAVDPNSITAAPVTAKLLVTGLAVLLTLLVVLIGGTTIYESYANKHSIE